MHLQLHGHVRIFLAEQPDHAGHQIGARGLAGTHDQRAALEVVQILQGPAGLLALAQDPVAVAEQQVTGFRELGFAPTPVK